MKKLFIYKSMSQSENNVDCMPGQKAIILVENEYQVKDSLNWSNEVEGSIIFIALSPFAMNELDKQEISYSTIEDYYESSELYKLGSENHKNMEELCHLIDKHIAERYQGDIRNITPAFFGIANVKMLHDCILVRVFQILNLIKNENPDKIYVYVNHPGFLDDVSHDIRFSNKELIYGYVLSLPDWRVDVVAIPETIHEENPFSRNLSTNGTVGHISFKDSLSALLGKYPSVYDLAIAGKRTALHDIPKLLYAYVKKSKCSPVLLLGSSGYNWDDCIKELRLAGISPLLRLRDDVLFWNERKGYDEIDKNLLVALCEELEKNEDFREFFKYGGIDFYPLLKSRIEFVIVNWTIACLKAYYGSTELMESKGIRAVVTSTMGSCTSQTIALSAREKQIPVITWQHGSQGYFDWPLVKYTDIIPSDYYFVFGDGVCDSFRHFSERHNTKIISVGSSSLSKLIQNKKTQNILKSLKLDPDKRVMVYAMANFYQNHLYISWSPPFSDNSLWKTQKSIMDRFKDHQDWSFIIKLHPSSDYSDSPAKKEILDENYDNYRFIKRELSFSDLLSIADAIVVDVPSTVLLQSLTTTKPIFCCLNHIDIDDKYLPLLEKRVYCSSDLKEFTSLLDSYLLGSEPGQIADLENREFLNLFGLKPGKLNVSEEIVKKMTEIIMEIN